MADPPVPNTCPQAYQLSRQYQVDATDLDTIAACTGCVASTDAAWDGLLGPKDSTSCHWPISTTGSGDALDGKALWAGSMVSLVTGGQSPMWDLILKCIGGGLLMVWHGVKATGLTPAGVYSRATTAPGCSAGPDTLTLHPVCDATPGRWYCDAAKQPDNLIGASASITTKDPKLKCEYDAMHWFSTSLAFVGITNTNTNSWAQTGYWKGTHGGQPKGALEWGIYLEVSTGQAPDPIDYFIRYGPVPGAGAHNYKVELDQASGTWTAYYDGSTWEDGQHTNTDWVDGSGTSVAYTAEISVKENDMVGTQGSPCEFSECKYRQAGGAYANAQLVAADVHSDDTQEWNYQYVDGTTFRVWDVHPL